jgi:Transposase IS66 family
LRLSKQKAAEHASSLFDLPITKTTVHHIKSQTAEKYLPTYHGILHEIATGPLIHADETKGVVKGGGHYIWVFANLTTVGNCSRPVWAWGVGVNNLRRRMMGGCGEERRY